MKNVFIILTALMTLFVSTAVLGNNINPVKDKVIVFKCATVLVQDADTLETIDYTDNAEMFLILDTGENTLSIETTDVYILLIDLDFVEKITLEDGAKGNLYSGYFSTSREEVTLFFADDANTIVVITKLQSYFYLDLTVI